MHHVIKHWYRTSYTWLTVLLLPLSWIFRLVVKLRRLCYRVGLFSVYRPSLPVIVVGNIAVGGTGKTPLVIFLVEALLEEGYTPGVLIRGFKGRASGVTAVTRTTTVSDVGDEAVLLFQRVEAPIIVSNDRAKAARYLIDNTDCDVIICDDGLQHYGLARDIEIVVWDGMRRFGNQALLPAGPLREPMSRLGEVDFVVTNGDNQLGEIAMHFVPVCFVSLKDPMVTKPLTTFTGDVVQAIAGIGNPDRFFNTLKLLGIEVWPHEFADHYAFTQNDIDLPGTVLMTEKDAVKCAAFADERHYYLRIDAHCEPDFLHHLLLYLKRNTHED